MSDYVIPQGNTGPSLEVYTNAMTSTNEWTCHQELITPDGTKIIDRAVTAVNPQGDRFIAFLTVEDTTALTVDTYTWRLTLSNASQIPAFKSFETHTVAIATAVSSQSNLALVRGENSFCDYFALLEQLARMPELLSATTAERVRLKAAMVEAWYDIGALSIDFGNNITTTRYFDAAALDSLTNNQRSDLVRAQLQQAEYILTAHPSAREATVRRLTTGDSTTVYRNNRAVIVCSEATRTLKPHMVRGQAHTAMLHV